MLFTQYRIQIALQDASRQLSTRQVLNQTDFIGSFCASGVALENCNTEINSRVNSAQNFATLDSPPIDPLSVGPGTATFNGGLPGEAVVAVVTYDWEIVFPPMRIFSNLPGTPGVRRLAGVAVFQNEPL